MLKISMPAQAIERSIQVVRGLKVMLDADLARLYGVETKRLNEAVRRNLSRFPEDFMFQLTAQEADSLRSQFATSKQGRGGRRYSPMVFTEQGVAMLSSVLNSKRAIAVNVEIVRVFVRLRRMLESNDRLIRRLDDFEQKVGVRFIEHEKHFKTVFEAIRQASAQGLRPCGPYGPVPTAFVAARFRRCRSETVGGWASPIVSAHRRSAAAPALRDGAPGPELLQIRYGASR
jgi:hypothetical protein